jgi:hypothetical protein
VIFIEDLIYHGFPKCQKFGSKTIFSLLFEGAATNTKV